MESEKPPERSRATAYVDASVTGHGVGVGYVMRCAGEIHVGSIPLQGNQETTSATDIEAVAALTAVRMLLARDPLPSAIDIWTDSLSVVLAHRGTAGDVGDTVRDMRAECAALGVVLSRRHCRGHSGEATAAGFLNDCAHTLANLAGRGVVIERSIPADAFWRLRVMACHEALVADQCGYGRDEAAAYLGVAHETVDALVRHGHLRARDGEHVTPETMIRVGHHIEEQGRDLPLVSGPLRRIRGRMDEPGCGFGDLGAPRCFIRMGMGMVHLPDGIGLVVTLEGSEMDTLHVGRLYSGTGPSWAWACESALELAFRMYPDCDFLRVHTPVRECVEALNGGGRLADMAFLVALDARIDAGLSFVAQAPPAEWSNDTKAWQVVLPRTATLHLMGGGTGDLASGSWRLPRRNSPDRIGNLAAIDIGQGWPHADGDDTGPKP